MPGQWPFAAGVTASLAPILALAMLSDFQDGNGPTSPSKDAGSRAERLLALHVADAASYSIDRDLARAERLELRREPIDRWSNPTRRTWPSRSSSRIRSSTRPP
jgi:hypothetical protein